MKTLEQIYNDYTSETLDGRDIYRLMKFVPEEDLLKIGIQLNDEYVGKHKSIAYTRRNVLRQLKNDVKFAFEKALSKRSLSAGIMHDVVLMWNWVLEDGLEDFDKDNYAQYSLPLFKATAVKYGWDNPIGDDNGNEFKYSADSDYYPE